MNDRIRHLAKKSGLLGRKFMFGEYYYDELSDEQLEFAELIVRECMSISSEAMTNDNWPPHMIAKHFGVVQCNTF
jgi:hypothetical protein